MKKSRTSGRRPPSIAQVDEVYDVLDLAERDLSLSAIARAAVMHERRVLESLHILLSEERVLRAGGGRWRKR